MSSFHCVVYMHNTVKTIRKSGGTQNVEFFAFISDFRCRQAAWTIKDGYTADVTFLGLSTLFACVHPRRLEESAKGLCSSFTIITVASIEGSCCMHGHTEHVLIHGRAPLLAHASDSCQHHGVV